MGGIVGALCLDRANKRSSFEMSQRRSLEERIEDLREQQEQISVKLTQLVAQKKQHDRKLETRRKIIAGALTLNALRDNPAVAKVVLEHWRRQPIRPVDRRVIEDLLRGVGDDGGGVQRGADRQSGGAGAADGPRQR